jgi:hypothetical protein
MGCGDRERSPAPNLHAVEGTPLDRFEIAECQIAKLGIDFGELRVAPTGKIANKNVPHRTRIDATICEPRPVARDRQRIVRRSSARHYFRTCGLRPDADDRLLKHVFTAPVRSIARKQVNGFAVPGPRDIADPRIVESVTANVGRSTAASRRDRQSSRRH